MESASIDINSPGDTGDTGSSISRQSIFIFLREFQMNLQVICLFLTGCHDDVEKRIGITAYGGLKSSKDQAFLDGRRRRQQPQKLMATVKLNAHFRLSLGRPFFPSFFL